MPIYSNNKDYIYPRNTIPIHNKDGTLILPKENGWYREILVDYLRNNNWKANKFRDTYRKGNFKICVAMNIADIGYESKGFLYKGIPLRTVVSKGIQFYCDEISAMLFEEHL